MNKAAFHIVLNDFVHDSRVLKECKSLLNEGYSITVFALHRDGLAKESIQDGLKIRRLPLATRKLPSFLKRLYLVQVVGYLELLIRFFFHTFRMRPVNFAHCHDLQALPLGIIIKIMGKTHSIIYDAHELEAERKGVKKGSVRQWFAKNLERLLIPWTDEMITVSKSIAIDYSNRYGCKEPWVILNCPHYLDTIPESNFLRKRLSISDSTRIFLYHGNLSNGRSIQNLLDIFECKALSYLDIALVFMGYGILEKEVKSRAKGPSNHIYFIPAVPPDQVLPISASADIGLSLIENMCLSYFYSLPNKLFEYIMGGLCVIASDFPETSKIVKKYSCGEVVNVEDRSEIGQVIEHMATIDLTPYRKNARLAARVLCWEQQETVLFDIYHQILRSS